MILFVRFEFDLNTGKFSIKFRKMVKLFFIQFLSLYYTLLDVMTSIQQVSSFPYSKNIT